MDTPEKSTEKLPPSPEGTQVQVGVPDLVQKPRRGSHPAIPGYEFLKKLGKGGMGTVWLVRDSKLNRLVALKMHTDDELTDADRTRFRTEAQAMAKLQHPNIVKVYEVNEHEGRPYFTMDYCPGGNLAEFLDRKPQPAKVCADILEQLARGVAHAHANGIIHRDLKPGNILIGGEATHPFDNDSDSNKRTTEVTPLGTPKELKITDFGLAKNTDASRAITKTEAMMGTPSYMSPEQASSSKDAGAAADQWSLGVMLYEMLTGGLPFVGADWVEILSNVREQDPIAPSERVKCPRDLETICLKCLRKDPRDRYASVQALADDLRSFQDDRSISARPMSMLEKSAKWVRRNTRVAALMTAFLVTLLTGTAVSLFYADRASRSAKFANDATGREKERADEAEQEKKRADAKTKEAVRETQRAETQLTRAEKLVYVNSIQTAQRHWNDGITGPALDALNSSRWDYRSWEHDYLHTTFNRGVTLKGHTESVTSVSFSPDGKRIVSGSADQTVKVWDAASGQEQLTLKGHTRRVTSVSFSPDGKRIVSGSWDQTVKVWDAASGQEQLTLKGHTESVTSVSFSPDGKRIVSGSWDKTVKVWDADSGQEQLTLKGHTNFVISVSFSPDGKQVFAEDIDGKILAWDSTTGQLLPDAPKAMPMPKLETSPDGKLRVAINLSGKAYIERLDNRGPDGLSPQQRQDRERLAKWAAWNPDWYTQQADESEKSEQWFAATFHLRLLVQHAPNDAVLAARLKVAEAKLIPPTREHAPLPRAG